MDRTYPAYSDELLEYVLLDWLIDGRTRPISGDKTIQEGIMYNES